MKIMNYIKYSAYIILTLALFTSCEDDTTKGVSRVTTFAEFTVAGEDAYVLPYGSDFVDPGATAEESGEPIDVSTRYTGTYFNGTSSTLNTEEPDIYTATYSAINKDGFPGSVTRSIVIAPPTGDFVNSLEGLYTMTVVRAPGGGPADADYTDREYGFITKVGENQYTLTDAIGGYYDYGRAYGPGYAAPGAVIHFEDGVATVVSHAEVGGFGGEATISNVSVDAEAKTLTFKADWPDYVFTVTYKQVQP